MAEIGNLLDDVLEKELRTIDKMPVGDERSRALRDFAQLHKLRIEEIRAKAEAEEKIRRREMDSMKNEDELKLKERELNGKDADRAREETLTRQQVRENRIDRCVRAGIAVAELAVPLIFYGVWMRHGFEFEKTGSFTSTTFRNLLNRFKPTK